MGRPGRRRRLALDDGHRRLMDDEAHARPGSRPMGTVTRNDSRTEPRVVRARLEEQWSPPSATPCANGAMSSSATSAPALPATPAPKPSTALSNSSDGSQPLPDAPHLWWAILVIHTQRAKSQFRDYRPHAVFAQDLGGALITDLVALLLVASATLDAIGRS